MVAASRAFDFPLTRERAGEAVDPFSPDTPLVWRYGRLRYATEPAAYWPTRWREGLRRLWYDRGKQPKVTEDARRVFNDERGEYGSYAEARAHCRTKNCYVVAMPFGRRPFGDELFDNPTFIRPELEPERDAEFSARYTRTLADHLCAGLSAENRRLRAELASIGAALEEDEHD